MLLLSQHLQLSPKSLGVSACDAGQNDNATISKFQIDQHLLSRNKDSGSSAERAGVIRDNGARSPTERIDKTY